MTFGNKKLDPANIYVTTENKTFTINYLDNSDKKTKRGEQKISGKYGENKDITLTAPNGYQIVGNQQVPTKITLTKNDSTNVYVEKSAFEGKKGDPATLTIHYLDSDNNNQAVPGDAGQKVLTGKIQGKIPWTKTKDGIEIPVPSNYVLDNDKMPEKVASEFTKAQDNISVYVKHKLDTVNGFEHKDNPDLYRNITETVHVKAPEGIKFTINGQQETEYSDKVSLPVYRNQTTDEVTGKTTVGKWQYTINSDKKANDKFPEYPVSSIKGYTAQADQGTIKDGKLSSFPLLQNGQPVKDFTVNVTYKLANPNAQITHTVNYVDADNNVVGKQSFTGKPKTKATEKITAPDKWTFVGDDGRAAGNTGTLDVNFGPENSSQNIKVTHKIDTNIEKQTVTETIKVTAPEGSYFEGKDGQHLTTQSIPVQLQVVRTNTTDEVANKTIYGEWKSNTVDGNKQPIIEFPAYTLPNFKGYTAQADQGTIKDGKLSSFPLLQNGQPVKDFTVNITYKSTKPDQPDNPGDHKGDHGDKPDQPIKADVKVTIQYLDQDNNNQVVAGGDQVETGKAGDKIKWQFDKDGKVELKVPVHYVLGDNKSNPDWSEIPDTFSDKNQNFNVYVKHAQSTLSAADHEADPNFHREITRTITNNLPGQKPQTIVDRVDYTRNGVKDEVTNKVTYDNWKVSSVGSAGKPVDSFRELDFAAKGYQVTITDGQGNKIAGTILPTEEVAPDSKNESYTVNYTAQTKPGEVVVDPSEVGKAATLTIQYKDSDESNKDVSTKTFNGKVGDAINWPMQDGYVSLTAPEHYILDSTKTTNSYPTKFAKTSQTIDVYLKHKIDQVSGGDHKDNADLFQKVTRTINITQPGQTKATPGSQSVEYYRIKKHDEVTGKDIYTPWTSMSVSAEDGKTPVTNYGEYALPVHDGYVEIATENGKELKVVDHKLQAEDSFIDGKPISRTVDVTYKANSTQPGQPDNPGDHKGDHGDKPDTPESKQLNWQDHQTDRNFYRVITRTVVYKMPNAAAQDSTDYVIFYRNGEQDANGKITYDKWQAAKDKTGQVKDSFSAVKVPEVAGYKAVITDQAGQKLDTIPKLTVTPDTKDQKLVVTYDAVKQHFVMNYVDNDDPTHLVATQTITGDPGQKVDFKMNVPENWKLAPDQGEYHTITFGSTDSKPVNIKVVHNTTQVTGNVDGNHDQDVYREITRVFNVLYPKYTNPVQGSQTLDLSRTKTYDPVTKKTTYTPWTVISTKNGQHVNEFTPYTGVTVVAGYDIVAKENGKVLAVTVNGNTAAIQAESAVDEHGNPINRVVEISFVKKGSGQNPADQPEQKFSKTINYVDSNDPNMVVGSQTVSGKNSQTVQVTLNVPEHWQTVEGNTTASVTINKNDLDSQTVYIKHKVETIKTSTDAKNSNDPDFYQTASQTVPTANGQTAKQDIPFYRTGTKDEVTGAVKFNQSTWKPVDQNNSKFKPVTIPAKDGYDVVATINGKETKLTPDKNGKYEINNSALDQFGRPANVEVKYVASGSKPVAPDAPDAPTPGISQDKVKHVINFVDSTNQVIGNQTVSGKNGRTISVKLNVPEHWQIAKNGATTTSITFDQTKNDPTTITIEHKIDQITNAAEAKQSGNDLFYKEIKRTFIINEPTTAARSMLTTFAAVPNADDNVQIVSFYRTGNYDEVTKKAKFTADWKPVDGKTTSFAPKIIKGKAGYNAYLIIDKDHKVQLKANANGDYEFPSEAATQDANYVIDFEKIQTSDSGQHNQNSGSSDTGNSSSSGSSDTGNNSGSGNMSTTGNTATTPSGSGAADSASTNNQSSSQNNTQDQTANSSTTNDESSSGAASADSSNADSNDYDDSTDYDDSDDDYADNDDTSTTTATRKTAYSNNNAPRGQNSQNRGANGIVHAAEVNASAASGSSMTSSASRAALPQTGENNDSLAVLGTGALAISLIGLAGVKKRRED